MVQEIKTFAPGFPGFYNTNYELDDYDEQQEVEELFGEGITVADYTVDNERYENDIAKRYCDELENKLSSYGVKKVTFEAVISPKFYNFTNDSINCTIEIDTGVLRQYIYENHEEFIKYIKDNYTSYDGFISSYSNDFMDWKEYTKDFLDYSEDKHYLGAVLEFVVEIEDLNVDLLNSTKYCLCLGEYFTLNDISWDEFSDEAIQKIFLEQSEGDLDYGFLSLEVAMAKEKAELFGTEWVTEMGRTTLESAIINPENYLTWRHI